MTTREDVAILYRELFGREPESETAIASKVGRPLLEVLVECLHSQEFSTRTRAATSNDIVTLYRELLGRDPEYAPPERYRTLIDIVIQLARSDEFMQRVRAVSEADVVRLYTEMLGYAPAEQEINNAKRKAMIDVAIETAKRAASEQAFIFNHVSSRSIRDLHTIFFPDLTCLPEWYDELARVLNGRRTSIIELASYIRDMSLTREKTGARKNSNVARDIPKLKNLEKFTVLIQARNGGYWLDPIVDFYADLGITVAFAVDASTVGLTKDILSKKGATLIDDVAAEIDTEWTLLLEENEVPSAALLEFVDAAVECSNDHIWGFPRIRCRYDSQSEELEYSQFLTRFIEAGELQWRLFANANNVWPILSEPPSGSYRSAPIDASLMDLTWVALGMAERFQFFQSSADGSADRKRHVFKTFYEAVPENWHMFTTVGSRRYTALAKGIAAAKGA